MKKLSLCVLLAACAATPAWVEGVRGPVAHGGEQWLCGVASAKRIANPALWQAMTENRARAEVAKVMQVVLAQVSSDAVSFADATDQGHLPHVLQTFSAQVLGGVQVLEAWEEHNTMYVLAGVRVGAVHEAIASMQYVGDPFKRAFREAFERATPAPAAD